MGDFCVSVGQRAEFTKTVGETDVYLFAGVTGDFSPNHVNQRYMERSSYGTRMAHGALLVGFMSTASTLAIADTRDAAETPVAVGYDRVRFLRPVLLGATITVAFAISRDLTLSVPMTGLAGSVLVALLVGALAGVYPATRAARIPPAEAVRSA